MKNKFTILGCGSSLGSPWITNFWGKCKKNTKENKRTRCSAHIRYKNISILIDTSPDIKSQLLKSKVKDVDAVIYTHPHADQASGIFELRPFFWKNKKKIPIFGSKYTIDQLKKTYSYCFYPKHGYVPILKSNIIKKNFLVKKNENKLNFFSFEAQHGMVKSTVFIFNKIAYISDCNKIPQKYIKNLKDLDYLIIDCLRIKKHPSHFNYDDAINFIKKTNPKKAILTNLHVDFDYINLKKNYQSILFQLMTV